MGANPLVLYVFLIDDNGLASRADAVSCLMFAAVRAFGWHLLSRIVHLLSNIRIVVPFTDTTNWTPVAPGLVMAKMLAPVASERPLAVRSCVKHTPAAEVKGTR